MYPSSNFLFSPKHWKLCQSLLDSLQYLGKYYRLIVYVKACLQLKLFHIFWIMQIPKTRIMLLVVIFSVRSYVEWYSNFRNNQSNFICNNYKKYFYGLFLKYEICYLLFHIPKLGQNLKFFMGLFHQAYTSYFWRVIYILIY